jgi:hypothetical protein
VPIAQLELDGHGRRRGQIGASSGAPWAVQPHVWAKARSTLITGSSGLERDLNLASWVFGVESKESVGLCFCPLLSVWPRSKRAYLETDRLENVGFYQKFGFSVIEEATGLGLSN